VTATSGSGPYEFSLNNGTFVAASSPHTFTGLAPGNYTVRVREGACVSNSYPFTITEGAGLALTVSATVTSCNGATDAVVTATSPTATASYLYTLDGLAPQSSNIFNGVGSGPHTMVVADGSGCVSNPVAFTVQAGPPITGSATSSPTACVGVNNGTITVTATGNGVYQYSLDNGAYQVTNVFTGVSAGAHLVKLRNAGGCVSADIPVTVAAGSGIVATTSTTSTACVGANNGSITVTPTNGTPPYLYTLDGGTTQSSNVFANLSAGQHEIIIADALGCSSASISVVIAAGTSLTGTAASTAVSCNGATNGTITVTATNGSPPYQYSLNGGASQTANVFTGIAAGNHTVIIRDNFGCASNSIPVSVANGNALNALATPASTTCSGATNGSITMTAPTNGTAPYVYTLIGGPVQASNVFSGLTNGNYTVVVTDAGGCSSGDIPVTITPGVAVTASLTKTDATCFGAATGAITARVSANATLPVQYSLDNINFQSANVFTALLANSYTVYFKDAAGCANSATITVAQPAQLVANSVVKDVLCNSESNGTITINVTGGTQPYEYSLDNTNFKGSNIFNVAAGNYRAYVNDANNCKTQVSTIVVGQPAVLSATAATSNATCEGSDGTITVTVVGGIGPYEYSSNGIKFQSSNILMVDPGTYNNVTVRDANKCSYTIAPAVVGLSNNLVLTPFPDPAPVCEGRSVQLETNTNATQFSWAPVAGVNNIAVANPLVNPSATTVYTVTATLGICSLTDEVMVSILPAPIPNAGPDAEICFGQNSGLQASGGASFSWSPATYLSDVTISNPQVTKPAQTITYSVSSIGANGCPSLVSDQMVLTVIPPIKVLVLPADTVVFAGQQFQFQASSIGTSYTWDPAAGLSNPNISNPIVTAPNTGDEITYHVRTTTAAGCEGQGFARVRVYDGPDIYMANAFTPNGDGKNDEFFPFPVGIKELKYFYVFNRWGEIVFSTKTINDGWDGRFKGVEQGNGVYTWTVSGITTDNRLITKKGTVMLIR
jgi:gliding motility-associated-like protein